MQQAIVAAQAGALAARRPECPSCRGRCHEHCGPDSPEPRGSRPNCCHKVTAFTDGCCGPPSILADAGVATQPIADWFHIARGLQHAKLAASGLLADEPGRKEAKAMIVAEVERLHWRIWNGTAKMPRRPSIASAGSCISTRVSAVIESEAWHPENCGMRFTRSTNISAARAPGLSTTPLDTAPAAHRDSSDGGHGEFPGQSPNEQVAADALVPARCRPGAASPLRSLRYYPGNRGCVMLRRIGR